MKPDFDAKYAVLGLLGAVLLGALVTVQVLYWHALGVESGGRCGSGGDDFSYDSCPYRSGLLLSVSFFPLFIVLPMALSLLPVLGGKVGTLVLVVATALGVLPGREFFHWVHGPTLSPLWTAPAERPADAETLGSWLHGSTVVRARFDKVVGQDLATGNVRWIYRIPYPHVLCTMSRDTGDGVGLVGYGEEEKACSRIAAVDLSTGRVLWTRNLAAGSANNGLLKDVPAELRRTGPSDLSLEELLHLPTGTTPDLTAVAGDVAAVRAGRALWGVGLRDGRGRWAQLSPKGCRFVKISGGAGGLLAVARCADQPPRLRAVDPVTGKVRWEIPVSTRSASAEITLLSAVPAVVRIREEGRRGIDTVVSFDDRGRARATIEVEDGRRRLDAREIYAFAAAPLHGLMVQGDRLVTIAEEERRTYVQAYGLDDGRLLWSTAMPDIKGIAVEPERVSLLVGSFRSPDLLTLSMRDGEKSRLGVTGFRPLGSKVMLHPRGDRYAVVCEESCKTTSDEEFSLAVIGAK